MLRKRVPVIDFLKTLPHVERDADYLNAPDYYPRLNALARDLRATRILEVGVRYGYSAVAFVYRNPVREYVGIDYELYDPESSRKSRANLDYLNTLQSVEFRLIRKNTQELTGLDFLEGTFDFIHIDGDHSYEGALTDLKNFWNVLESGGHMLVDDSIFLPSVANACATFAAIVEEPHYNVKTYRGTRVFLKTRERHFSISQSAANELTRRLPVEECDIARRFYARHPGWSGPVLLLKDGTFRGGPKSPDGRWQLVGEILTLAWYHWPENILKSNGSGSYFAVTGSDGLALYKWPGLEGDAHLRGNLNRGDPVVTEKPTLEHIDDAVRSKLEPK